MPTRRWIYPMFFSKFCFWIRLFIICFVVSLSVYVYAQPEPCVFVPVKPISSCEADSDGNSISEQMKSVVCPFPSLRSAMADERMAQIIAGKNVFQTIESNDVVRLQKGVGLYVALNPLRRKINKTYEDFYKIAQVDFTLNIATYPAETKKGTCTNHSTIIKNVLPEDEQEKLQEHLNEQQELGSSETLGVKRKLDGVFGDYATVEGKSPRHFELRRSSNEKKDIFICEASKNSLNERMDLYCGDSDRDECKQQMPPLCSEWDEKEAQNSKRKNTCAALSEFEQVSGEFFLHNVTMNQFCPEDCSYYVQLLQRVRKDKDGGYCTESHAIVHCGPKKTEAKYNLNIKVVDDFCEDFNVMCVPSQEEGEDGVQDSKVSDLLSEVKRKLIIMT